jgi:stage IV sporulation protein FB
MLGNAAPTPLDLRFSLLGIPVRVHPLFWLFTAVLGWNPDDLNSMFLWIVCVFVSILVHEFGHALTARHFGTDPHVVLYAFGGYASFYPVWGYNPRRSILVLAAGPGAGFVLYGAIWCLQWAVLHFRLIPGDPHVFVYLMMFFGFMKFINLWWGLVNLLPVFPLDGGQIAREGLVHMRPRDGLEISLKLSLLVGVGLAAYMFMNDMMFHGMLFGSLAFESLQHLQGMRYR